MIEGESALAHDTRLNLPDIRKNRGISLRAIERDTRIRLAYLEAIESERFDLLPGEIYTVSYIRQYAHAIDYDENSILALYRSEVRTPEAMENARDRSAGETMAEIVRLIGVLCRRLWAPLIS